VATCLFLFRNNCLHSLWASLYPAVAVSAFLSRSPYRCISSARIAMASNESPPQPGEAPAREHRKQHPCVQCQQRKIKCDRNAPCRNCLKSGLQCLSAASLPPRKRKRRFPEAELLARIRRYEHHLKSYGADLDAINNEGSRRDAESVPRSIALKSNHSESPALSPGDTRALSADPTRSLSVRQSLKNIEK
jgi:hypothetical protein